MKKSINIILSTVLFLGVTAQAYAEERGQGGPGPRPEFSSIDIDGSGEISFDELSEQKLPGGDVQEIFDSIDADSDGVITEQEFIDHKPPAPPRH